MQDIIACWEFTFRTRSEAGVTAQNAQRVLHETEHAPRRDGSLVVTTRPRGLSDRRPLGAHGIRVATGSWHPV
jgi:hypothetical protein